MLRAFARENHSGDFDWEGAYGGGFDVLNISTSPRFFASGDATVDLCVQLMLAEYGVGYARGAMGPGPRPKGDSDVEGGRRRERPIRFVDNDAAGTVLVDPVEIMVYIHEAYGTGRGKHLATPARTAREWSRTVRARELLERLRDGGRQERDEVLRAELGWWDERVGETEWAAGGPAMTLADYVLWPVLHEILGRGQYVKAVEGSVGLRAYYEAVKGRESVQRVLGGEGGGGKETPQEKKSEEEVASQ
jgi:hypothetical protein